MVPQVPRNKARIPKAAVPPSLLQALSRLSVNPHKKIAIVYSKVNEELHVSLIASPKSTAVGIVDKSTNDKKADAMAKGPNNPRINFASNPEGKRRVRNWMWVA